MLVADGSDRSEERRRGLDVSSANERRKGTTWSDAARAISRVANGDATYPSPRTGSRNMAAERGKKRIEVSQGVTDALVGDDLERTSVGRSGLLLEEELELVDGETDELVLRGLGADSERVPVRERGRVHARHDGSDALRVDRLGLGQRRGT